MLKNLPLYLANARKAIIQVTGLVTSLLALGLLPNKYAVIAASIVAVLTTIAHYMTPNADAPGTTPARMLDEPQDADPGAVEPEYVGEHVAVDTASEVASDHQISAPPTE